MLGENIGDFQPSEKGWFVECTDPPLLDYCTEAQMGRMYAPFRRTDCYVVREGVGDVPSTLRSEAYAEIPFSDLIRHIGKPVLYSRIGSQDVCSRGAILKSWRRGSRLAFVIIDPDLGAMPDNDLTGVFVDDSSKLWVGIVSLRQPILKPPVPGEEDTEIQCFHDGVLATGPSPSHSRPSVRVDIPKWRRVSDSAPVSWKVVSGRLAIGRHDCWSLEKMIVFTGVENGEWILDPTCNYAYHVDAQQPRRCLPEGMLHPSPPLVGDSEEVRKKKLLTWDRGYRGWRDRATTNRMVVDAHHNNYVKIVDRFVKEHGVSHDLAIDITGFILPNDECHYWKWGTRDDGWYQHACGLSPSEIVCEVSVVERHPHESSYVQGNNAWGAACIMDISSFRDVKGWACGTDVLVGADDLWSIHRRFVPGGLLASENGVIMDLPWVDKHSALWIKMIDSKVVGVKWDSNCYSTQV